MITSDVFIEIGSSHRTCEDYIIQGSKPTPYIILADGCSSSTNTEMGARILCHLAKQYLKYREDDLYGISYENMGRWIIHNAEMTARQLGLSIPCLDATLVIAFHLDDKIKIFMYGDGVIIRKSTGGKFIVDFVEFKNNAPFYLSYLIDEFRFDTYHSLKIDKNVISIASDCSLIEENNVAYDFSTEYEFQTALFSSLFICSDGILSFIYEDPTNRKEVQVFDSIVEDKNMLEIFMAFKNTKGEYLKRRMKRALKTLKERGINHYDDLSIGSFMRT